MATRLCSSTSVPRASIMDPIGGATDVTAAEDEEPQRKLKDDFDVFTTAKANDLAEPLDKTQIPYKIQNVMDYNMKERLCSEVERLGLGVVNTGSQIF